MPLSRGRKRWIIGGVLGLAVLLVVAGGIWTWWTASQLDDVTRFNAGLGDNTGHDRPEPAADTGSETILLAGVDNGDRADLQEALAADEWQPGVFRSDAIMVLHLTSDRKHATLVSIPRDSWVPIDGYGTQKINAAFSYGGPALLAHTVEQVADVRLDRMMVVDWDGFEGITRTLGGVEIGGKMMDPKQALAYVRERYSLPRGDFDRVERQQAYLMGVLRGLQDKGSLTNPVAVTQLVGDLSDLVSVDAGTGNRDLIDLGLSGRGISPQDIDRMTAPNNGTGMVDGQSIVRLDVPATRRLFDEITAKG